MSRMLHRYLLKPSLLFGTTTVTL